MRATSMIHLGTPAFNLFSCLEGAGNDSLTDRTQVVAVSVDSVHKYDEVKCVS